MATLLAGAVWAALIAWLLVRALRQFAAHRASAVTPTGHGEPGQLPSAVAVIVPARNEIRNIEACLAGLAQQSRVVRSITVVDDESQDGTGEAVARAARQEPRLVLETPGLLPPGWMGKPHACWHGAL